MKTLPLKEYQKSLLTSVEEYFRACREWNDAKKAFHRTMEKLWGGEPGNYRPIAGFDEGMPYFCLRVPTGGGKTFIGAKCVTLVNQFLFQTERSVILWLVPSNAIREQTLKAFRDREHPYRSALGEAGAVTVLDLEEARGLRRGRRSTPRRW
jgi:type III restriction enzyme